MKTDPTTLDNTDLLNALYALFKHRDLSSKDSAHFHDLWDEVHRRLRAGPPPPAADEPPARLSNDRLLGVVNRYLSPFWKEWPAEARHYLGDLMTVLKDRLCLGVAGPEAPKAAASPLDAAAVGNLIRFGVDVLVRGVAAGFVQVEDFSSGKTYPTPWLNECYDTGVNLGQFLGRTTQLPKDLRKRERAQIEDLKEYRRVDGVRGLAADAADPGREGV